MHQPISAGKLVQLNFDDPNKRVEVCAKVLDNNEWEKVLEGAYTGFSFGGMSLKKWLDPVMKGKRYTLDPNELSLADKPCVPSALFFDVMKVDGTVEKRKFIHDGGIETVPNVVQKSMYDVSSLAQLMQTLDSIRCSTVWEAQQEGDNSPVPEKLKAAIDTLAAILVEMTQEETAELTAKLDIPGTIQKAGARNSKEDLDKLQTIHDHVVTLGACCQAPASEETQKLDKGVTTVGQETTEVNKVDIAGEIKKVLDPVTASIQKLSGAVEKMEQTTGAIETINQRLAKLEAQPEPAKAIVKTVVKEYDTTTQANDSTADALSEIKKAHNAPTWAY